MGLIVFLYYSLKFAYMKKLNSSLHNAYIALSTFCFLISQNIFARAGGGGGHSHSSSSHSGGGFSGGSGFYSTGSGGGLSTATIIIIIVVVIIYLVLKRSGKLGGITGGDDDGDDVVQSMPDKPLPEGLDKEKIKSSFLSIQDAWQKKELKNVRKWVSDGVYQRFNAQFAMMNKLSHVNKLTNIKVDGIKLANAGVDGHYQTADVAISFTMDDEFI